MPLQKCKFLPDVYVDAVFIEIGFFVLYYIHFFQTYLFAYF